MHPILGKPRWLALYLLAWLPFAALITMSLRGGGSVSWEAAAALSLPAAWMLAFMCLTPWYTCRWLPLGTSSALRLAIGHGAVALISIGALRRAISTPFVGIIVILRRDRTRACGRR